MSQSPKRKQREFGDLMSKEGETSHIPIIILVMYSSLVAYSFLCSLVTNSHWYTQLVAYCAALAAFYAWHWMAHQRFMGAMYEIHMEHHMKNFPPSNFYGSPGTIKRVYGAECPTLWELMDPRKSTNFTWKHEGPLYAMNVLIVGVAYFVCNCTLGTMACMLSMYVLMGTVGSALHSSFHVRGFHLERYKWYKELRSLHYIHHLGSMQHNYAVLNLGLDGLFNSLMVIDPLIAPKKNKPAPEYKNLPPGISAQSLDNASTFAGLTSHMLFIDVPPNYERSPTGALSRGYPTVLLRLVLVGLTVYFWQQLEPGFALSVDRDGSLLDIGHVRLAALREFLLSDPSQVRLIGTVSYFVTTLSLVALILCSVLGSSYRPGLTVTFAMLLRFAVVSLSVASAPASYWQLGNFPQLYLFFPPERAGALSMEIILACICLGEVPQFQFSGLHGILVRGASLFWLLAQIVLHVALQDTWTSDVLWAIILARYSSVAARIFASKYIDFILP